MDRLFRIVCFTLGGLLLTASGYAQATYDASADYLAGWNSDSNPNGVWSYGYSTSLLSVLNRYTTTTTWGGNGGNELFWYSPSVDTGFDPTAALNHGPAIDNGNINFLANELVLTGNPGSNGYSHVVFTAPTNGIYSIAAGFRNDQYGSTTNGYISANSILLDTGSLTTVGQTMDYTGTVSLLAGQTIDFAVNNPGYSNSGFSAVITSSVPEASTLLSTGLLLAGSSLIVRRRRK